MGLTFFGAFTDVVIIGSTYIIHDCTVGVYKKCKVLKTSMVSKITKSDEKMVVQHDQKLTSEIIKERIEILSIDKSFIVLYPEEGSKLVTCGNCDAMLLLPNCPQSCMLKFKTSSHWLLLCDVNDKFIVYMLSRKFDVEYGDCLIESIKIAESCDEDDYD